MIPERWKQERAGGIEVTTVAATDRMRRCLLLQALMIKTYFVHVLKMAIAVTGPEQLKRRWINIMEDKLWKLFFSVSRDFKQWLNGKYVIRLQTFQRTSCLYGQVTRSFAQGIGWCEKGSCCTWLWFGSWEGMPEIKPVNKTHSLVFSF